MPRTVVPRKTLAPGVRGDRLSAVARHLKVQMEFDRAFAAAGETLLVGASGPGKIGR